MQAVSQSGSGNVAVQIEGDGNTVTISCGGIVLHLLAKHARRREVRSDQDLLRPETRLLGLVGREAETSSLSAWLDDPRPVLVRGLTGRAGSGKTRLAIELCEVAAARGWQAGFLDSGDLAVFVAAERTAKWPRHLPMLVVVDYAARRARALNAWLHGLARRADPSKPRLRLLLLERHATLGEGWWAELLRLEGSDDSIHDLVDPFEPVPLPPIEAIDQRRALLGGIMAEWCRRNGRPMLAPPPAGADPPFDLRLADPLLPAEPLHLMMAGLVAARHGLGTLLSLGRLDLALEIACWERDRLATLAGERGVNAKLLLHLVAAVTLLRGLDRGELHALIDAERAALPYERDVEGDALAGVLSASLPVDADGQSSRIGHLEPDIIGETFCLLILATNRDLDPEMLIDRCGDRAPARTAQHLILTVHDFARPAAELTTDTTQRSRRPEARLLAGWLGDTNPAVGWLDRLVAGTDDLDRLISIANQMPEHTVLLRKRAMRIYRRIVELLRPVASASSDQRERGLFAQALNNLSISLGALGRREPALAAAEEAVQLYRELAASWPDRFRPGLAMSLITLASRLSDLGQREAALASAEEAMAIQRELAAAQPDAFRPDLAGALNNLANLLSELGRREAALAVAEEAAGLYRELAASWPDRFRPGLATSLITLASRLSNLGRREAALAAAEEAAKLYRELAAARPDAFRPNLAGALNNFANLLSQLGRREAALVAAEEAAGLYRELAAVRPDAFRPDLAGALNNLANLLSELGRREAALVAAEEAAGLYRELATVRPDAFRPDLAMSLNNLASRLSDLGRPQAALVAAEEAVAIRRELAAAQPDAFRPDLASALNNLAPLLSELGRREAALAAVEEAAGLYRELAAAQPDAFRPDLAMSLNNLGNALSELGRRDAALAAAEEAVAVRRELAAARPDAFRPNLSSALSNLANRLSALGRHEAALVAAEEAVAILRELAAALPDALRPNLAMSLAVLARCLGAAQRSTEALAANAEAIAALREPFIAMPRAFERWMLPMVEEYLQRSVAQGIELDEALLEPIMLVLRATMEQGQEDRVGRGEA